MGHTNEANSDGSSQSDRMQFLADLAEAFYLGELTQMEVADKFRLARPTVSRLLAEARNKGVIEFKIHRAFQSESKIAARLAERFGLAGADVVSLPERVQAQPLQAFGRFAAETLHAVLAPGTVLGLTLGSTVAATVDELSTLTPLPIKVVQLCGSVGAADPTLDTHAIVQKLAQAFSSVGIHFYAPLVVDSQAVRDSLRNNPINKACLDLGRQADLAVVGIGSFDRSFPSLHHGGQILDAEIERLRQAGAMGDVGGFSIDSQGNVVEGTGAFWLTGIDLDDFLAIRQRIALATGMQKVSQIRAALRGRLITHLVTDKVAALALLEEGAG